MTTILFYVTIAFAVSLLGPYLLDWFFEYKIFYRILYIGSAIIILLGVLNLLVEGLKNVQNLYLIGMVLFITLLIFHIPKNFAFNTKTVIWSALWLSVVASYYVVI